jgi:hypothetical protein
MLQRTEILNILREYKPYLQAHMGVNSLALFGSYARETADADSDIDILVELEAPRYEWLVQLQEFLEEKLHAPVDLTRQGPHLQPQFLETIQSDLVYA